MLPEINTADKRVGGFCFGAVAGIRAIRGKASRPIGGLVLRKCNGGLYFGLTVSVTLTAAFPRKRRGGYCGEMCRLRGLWKGSAYVSRGRGSLCMIEAISGAGILPLFAAERRVL